MKIFFTPSPKRILALVYIICLLLGFNSLQAQIEFTKSNLNFNNFGPAPMVTSLTYGPDGRLYVLDYPGTIYAYTIQRNGPADYVVTAKETIATVKSIPNHDDDGSACSGLGGVCTNREATGLVVTGSASNPVLYVTSSDFRIGSGMGGGSGDVDLDTNSGVITRLTWNGNAWNTVDIVRGLPRSEENHATNGLEFTTIAGIDYLIVAQGGNANGGAPSINFSLICEYALSAAILSVNLTMLETMPILNDAGRNYIYNLPTLDDPTRANANGITDPNDTGYNGIDVNDPWGGNDGLNQAMIVAGGPVQIFSPGYRNPYDLVLTESGAVYTTDNGANAGWGGFPVNEGGGSVTNAYDPNETGGASTTATADGEFVNNKDHLQLITTNINNYTFGSFYGGHPNPTRANPNGAGLYTAPATVGTSGAVFRTMKYDPDNSSPGSTSNASIALPANWPPVQFANAVEGDFRGPGDVNPDGPDDNPVTTWATNTNGIDEYTASNFGGAMKGNLLAGTSQGAIRRVELKADGTLDNFTPTFLDNIGGNTLGISCNGDNEIFPGTIWAGTLNKKIVVFEPQGPEPVTFPFRINAGGPESTYNGDVFLADQYFVDGISFSNNSAQVPLLFQSEHTSTQGDFNYKIPVLNGNYDVILYFAEIFWNATGGQVGGSGNRIFDVTLEGNLVLDDYDINADVGSETSVAKTFNVSVSDGFLDMNFSGLASTGGIDQPKVSAIAILEDMNTAPVAVATATPTSGTIPLEVVFTGDTSTDDVGVVNYLWNFNDGSPTSNVANPTHTFTTAGVYNVQLTVEDVEGASNTTTVIITANSVVNTAPVAIANATPLSGIEPLEVSFTGDSSTDDVAVVSYLWNFNDGTPTSSDANPIHTFTIAGTYVVQLTVEDAAGLSDDTNITITVDPYVNTAPIAIASANVLTGNIPLEVSFTGDSSNDNIAVESYLWDFKDGSSTSSEANPVHTFTTAGDYEVQLIVTDGEGLTDTTTVTITASLVGNEPPVAVISATPERGTVPLEVEFTASNSTDDIEIISYLWNFGDGSSTAAEIAPNHTFTSKGTFEVSLTVTDDEGLSNTQLLSIAVLEDLTAESKAVGMLMLNPAKDIAQVRIVDSGSELRRVTKIYIHDASGRLVGKFNPKQVVKNGLYEIPIASLSSGEIYYIGFDMDKGDRIVMTLIVSN